MSIIGTEALVHGNQMKQASLCAPLRKKVSKCRVFPGPYFPVFGLNAERYLVSLRIQSECGKIQNQKKLRIWTFCTQCTVFKIKRC